MSAQDHSIFTGILSGYVALNREGRVTVMDRVTHDLLAQVGSGLGRCWQEVFPPHTALGRALGQVWQSGQPALLSAPAPSGSARLFTRVAPTADGAEVHLELCEVGPGPWDPGQNTARLLQLIQELNAAPGLDAMVDTFVRHLHQEAYGVLLALHDPARLCLNLRYAVDYDEELLKPFLQVPLQMRCPATDVFHSGELLILSREECLTRYRELPLADETQEVVVVPLQASRGVVGVLLISLRERGTLGPLGRSQLMLLCSHMAGAIERTQLAEEARRNEGRYRTLLESTSAILWETESDFQVVRNMPTWEAFTGQTFREYRGQGYMNAVHPEDRPAVENAIQEGLRSGGRFAMQGRLMTACGVYRQVVAQAVPVLGEDDEVLAWMGTVQDVTDAHQHQLRETATREVLLQLSRASSAREVYEVTLAEVVGRTGAQRALLAGVSRNRASMRILAAREVPDELRRHLSEFTVVDGTPLGQGVAGGEPVWLRDILARGPRPNLLPEGLIEQQGEILLVPLHHQQDLVALLALAFARDQDLPDQALDQLRWLQPHLAQALQRAQLQGALERSEEHGRTILSALDEGVVLISSRGRIVSANQPARRLLGLGDDGPLGSVFNRHWEITDTAGFTVPPDRYPALRALRSRQPVRNEVVCVVSGGTSRWLSVNAIPITEGEDLQGVVMSLTDITESYTLRQQLELQAQQDELTSLPNRRVFRRVLEQLAATEKWAPVHAAVLLVDVDQFKLVNDSYGQQVGDALLRSFAQRLSDLVQGRGIVTRLAGDEFGLILDLNARDQVDVSKVAQEVLDALRGPLSVQGIELQVTASVGVCATGQGGAALQDLPRNAGLALGEAKRQGAGLWRAFSPSLAAAQDRRIQVERRLRRALQEGELEVAYQPIVELGHNEWSTFEALARWTDEELGRVSPPEFIRVAEESGLINELGQFVMQRALEQSVVWTAQWSRRVSVNVNVSATQLMRPDFVTQVEQLLRSTGAHPQQLTLEITEAVVIQQLDFVIGQLQNLRRKGVRVAMDDFGTGFSSLAVLSRLPIDALKVDQAFVRGVYREPRRQALLSAVVLLGQRLGISVVAEGVEEQRELDVLQGLGCTHAQGYYLSRPADAASFDPT